MFVMQAEEIGSRESADGGRDGIENDPQVVSAVDEQELVSAQKTSADVFPGAEDLGKLDRSSALGYWRRGSGHTYDPESAIQSLKTGPQYPNP